MNSVRDFGLAGELIVLRMEEKRPVLQVLIHQDRDRESGRNRKCLQDSLYPGFANQPFYADARAARPRQN